MSEQALKVTINDASEPRIIGAVTAGIADYPKPFEEPAAQKTKGGK